MKLKICGMKYGSNIEAVAALQPDYMGFIFYEKSKRFVGESLDEEFLSSLDKNILKVGVFVNQTKEYILAKAKRYGLSVLQLHGDESPEFCSALKNERYTLIKVFQADEHFDFAVIEPFKKTVDYFLFDTKSEGYGGTGKKFDWSLFEKYDNEIPIFLSGGIDPESIDEIKKLKHLNIHALDINSKFETEPALKDIEKIKKFIHRIR